jgi:2-polyprenyl-3-methyl-5-hydroxy-6-metoxy-1,4-benzoquinol methylase
MLRVYEHDCQSVWEPNLNPGVYISYNFRLTWFERFIKLRPSRILEAGCAQATLGLRLAEQGHQVLAVDIREDFLKYAQLRYTHGKVEFKSINLCKESIPDCFDLIYLNQVVEHVNEPTELLSRLGGSLKAGGEILITTPNYFYFRNNLPTFSNFSSLPTKFLANNTADGDDHVFAYTTKELTSICSEAGLFVVATGFYETPFLSGHACFRLVNRYIPIRLLNLLEQLLCRIPQINEKFRYQLYILARKPTSQEN